VVYGEHDDEEHVRLKLPEDPTIFISERHGTVARLGKWLGAALAKAKIEGVIWHTLHHTFASRLVMAEVHLKTVQELMGRKAMAMTARYAHRAPSHTMAALKLFTPVSGPGDCGTKATPERTPDQKKASKAVAEVVVSSS
jgi:site-specific recombinase XerD